MIVYMRGVWRLLPRVGALVIAFAGTVGAMDKIRCRDQFNPVSVNSDLDTRVNNYIEVVRKTKSTLAPGTNDPKTLRSLAKMWINGSKSGKLQQIYPGYCGESLIEGPKSEIFSSCMSIVTKLAELGSREAAEGNPQGYNDAILAMELTNVVRFGNYETLFSAGNYLRRPLRVVRENVDRLSKNQKLWLERVQNPSIRDQKTNQLAMVAKRLRQQYQARYGEEMAKEDDLNYSFFLNRKSGVAANHFYGFDRETKLNNKLRK